MTAYDRLDLLFQQNNGIVKTAQVLEIGIAKSTFYAYAKQRGVEQAAHGVYVSPDAWTDAMYLLHLRCAQAVFSHESALFFHDLTDREPSPYSITVKTGYNPASLQADGIKVYTIKKELHDVGIVTMNPLLALIQSARSFSNRPFWIWHINRMYRYYFQAMI